MLEDILTINIEYLQRYDINIEDRSNIPKALVMIKNYWSSSKVKNEKMTAIKKYLLNYASICTGKRTKWILVTLVIAFVLYVFLRSLKIE